MEVLLVLMVVGLVLCGPAALIIALVTRRDITDLQRRMERMERALTGDEAVAPAPLRPGVAPVTPAPPAVAPAAMSVTPAPGAPPPPRPVTLEPLTPRLDIETILGGQWLTWLGILAIFFGTAFFLAYDLGNSPLAGTGQVMTGLLVAVIFLAGGRTMGRRLGRFLARGLLGGGVALLFLSAYASHAFHHLVPASVVYPFLFGAAAVGVAMALLEDSLMVATLTQTGALLTPFFLTGRGEASGPLFIYLAAVTLGATILSRRRRWPVLTFTGFLGVVVLVVWWWGRAYTPDLRGATLLRVALLWLLIGGVPLLRPRPKDAWGAARAFVLVANGLLFELAVWALLDPDFRMLRGLATALLSLACVAGARLSLGREERAELPASDPIRVTHYTGLMLAALAVPVQFDLQWVTFGWSLMALVLLVSGLSSSGLGERLIGWGVLVLAIGHALTWDVAATFRETEGSWRPVLNGQFLVGVAAAATLGLAAWITARNRPRLSSIEKRLVTPLILTAAVVLLVRASAEAIAWFGWREHVTGMTTHLAMLLTLSFIWAVYAGGLILGGFVFRYRPVRYLGIVVLVILMLKVFIFDIQALERGYRIASFVGVGLLLLLVSILYQKERRTT